MKIDPRALAKTVVHNIVFSIVDKLSEAALTDAKPNFAEDHPMITGMISSTIGGTTADLASPVTDSLVDKAFDKLETRKLKKINSVK